MKELSHRDRKEIFDQVGITNPKRNPRYNIHHVYQKRDKREHSLPTGFNVNQRSNLIPLEIPVHNELHKIIDNNTEYRNDISLRVYFANMAFCGDLSDVPDRMYRVLPQVRK